MGIKEELKKNKLIYKTWKYAKKKYNVIRNKYLDNTAFNNFNKERKIKHKLIDGKINIGFLIVQEPFNFGKTEPIFLALKNDERFKVTLICCPPWIGTERIMNHNCSTNTNFEYFVNKYHNVVILNALNKEGRNFIDIRKFDFSYVFYNSPYSHYYPKKYHPKIVSSFTKICYTPYGYILSKIFYPIATSWDFFRWVYCCYACSTYEKQFLELRIKNVKFQRIAYCGFPRIYEFINKKEEISEIIQKFNSNFNVIWTPRWSTEDAICGSNFFKYKDFFIKLKSENENINFILRPHPLTFSNFIKTKQMTEEEVQEYKKNWNTANSVLDETPEYASTFWETKLLITDFSSVIIEYFITGNPIIFCTTNTNRDLPTDEFLKILDCCYIAHDEKDIINYLHEITNDNDYLKEKRDLLIKDIFGKNIKRFPELIIKDLYQDWININKVK